VTLAPSGVAFRVATPDIAGVSHRPWIVVLLVGCGSTDLAAPHDSAPAIVADARAPDDLPGADLGSPPDVHADGSMPDAPPADAPAPDAPAADVAVSRLDRAADWPPCGHIEDRCCPDLSCVDAETVCVGSDPGTALCKRCGRSQGATILPCCPGNRCLDGSCCVHLQTANVGPFCIGVGSVCFDTNSRCQASGSCGPGCGAAGQPCCEALGTPYCSASGTACMRATGAAAPSCVACGQAGQPCCQQVASPYSIPPCAVGLRCLTLNVGDRCG
jgi:hypothetical protein